MADPFFALKMYGMWAVAALLFFGVWGVNPLIRVLVDKYNTILEMKSINLSMSKKIDEINKIRVDTDAYAKQIELLNSYLPDGDSTQNYLVDLSFTGAISGHILTQLSSDTNTEGGPIQKVTAKLSGSNYLSIPKLVKDVESMKTITQISSVTFSSERGLSSVDLSLEIYYMGK